MFDSPKERNAVGLELFRILRNDSRLQTRGRKLKIGFVGLTKLSSYLLVSLSLHPDVEFILYIRPGSKEDREFLKISKLVLPDITIRPAPCYRGLCEAHWVITLTDEDWDEDALIEFTDLNPYTKTKFIHLDGMRSISPSVHDLIPKYNKLEELPNPLEEEKFSYFYE